MSPVNFLRPALEFKYNPEAVTNCMAEYLYTLRQDAAVKPMRLFVYPTGLCNDSCRYCSDGSRAGGGDYGAFLKCDPKRDFFNNKVFIDKLVADIKNLRIRDVHLFGGGEPFFYKEQTFYFLEQLKETDVFIRVITNAKNLGREDMFKIIKGGLISQLNISFNTESRQTAEKLYADSSRHQHSVDALGAITEYKGKYKVEFPKIDIMFTILNINYNRVTEIINLLKGHSINYFMFQPLRCYTSKQKEFALTKEQEEEFSAQVPAIERMLHELGVRSNIGEFKKNEQRGPSGTNPAVSSRYPELVNKHGLRLGCYIPLTTLSICYNGNIPLCQFKYDQQYKQNYFELKELKEFIKSEDYSSFVRSFIDTRPPATCSVCNFCVPFELEIMKQRFLAFTQKKR